MIDAEQLKMLAQLMEQQFAQLQSAQESVDDPQLRGELKAFEDMLRDTHNQLQKEVPAFVEQMKADLQAAEATLEEAKQKVTEAAAEREQALAAVAAREVEYQEIDPLLNEKLHSDLLEDFGNRDRLPPRPPTRPAVKSGEVWQDWPETAAPPPQSAAAPAAESLPPGVRPYARLIDPQLGEQLRQALLAEYQQTPASPPPSPSEKDVWQDWPVR